MAIYNYILNEGILSSLFGSRKSSTPSLLYKLYYKKQTIGFHDDAVFSDSNSAKRCFIDTLIGVINGTMDYGKVIVKSKFKKTYEEYLEREIFIYSIEVNDYTSSNHSLCDGKVKELVFEGTVKEAISKYQVEVEISDTSKIEAQRTAILKKLKPLASKAISMTVKEYPKANRGFSIYKLTSGEDEFEDFISGIDDYIPIIDCDAWAFCDDKARDKEKYAEYTEVFNKLFGILKDLVAKDSSLSSVGKIDYYGDWDDGPIAFELFKKKK